MTTTSDGSSLRHGGGRNRQFEHVTSPDHDDIEDNAQRVAAFVHDNAVIPCPALSNLQPWWQALIRGCALSFMAGVNAVQAATLVGFRNRWCTTRVGRVRVLEAGTPQVGRPSWVFIHGYASQALDWAPLLRLLRKKCGHLIAVDMPGHGRSTVPSGGLSEATVLTALQDVAQQCLGPNPRCILVGNSTGGLGAIRLAQVLKPEMVQYLVLISPLGGPMSQEEIQAVLQGFRLNNLRKALTLVDQLFLNNRAFRRIKALAVWAHLNRPTLLAFSEQLRSCRFLRHEELRNMPPSLLIWGDSDRILPMSGRDFFHAALPKTCLVRTPHFGHAPFLDVSRDVLGAIETWAAQDPGFTF